MVDRAENVDIRIRGDARGVEAAAERANKALGKLRTDVGKSLQGLGGEVFSLRGAIAGLLGGFSFATVIRSTVEAEAVTKQLEARLRSTGRTAEFTAEQLGEMADRLRDGTTFDDEAVAQAQTTLLTFGNVAGEAFDQALTSALDLSSGLGVDLSSAAETVGRALQSPEKAARALRSANIILTEAQENQIKSLVEAGRSAEAQEIILDRLQSAYGGAAKAAGDGLGGALADLKNAAGDLLEGEGGSLTAVTAGVNNLAEVLKSESTREAFQAFTAAALDAAAGLASLGVNVINLFRDLSPAEVISNEIRLIDEALAASSFLGKPIKFLAQNEDELKALRAELVAQGDALRAANDPAGALTREITQLGAAYAELQKVLASGAITDPAPLRATEQQAAQILARIKTLREQQNASVVVPPPSGGNDVPLDPQAAARAAAEAAKLAERIADASAQAQAGIFAAELARSQAALEASYAARRIEIEQYYADKLALDQAGIDQEIAARTEALTRADAAERIRIEGELEALRIRRVAAAEQNVRDEAAAITAERERLAKDNLDRITQEIDAVTRRFEAAQQAAANRVITGDATAGEAQAATREAADAATAALQRLRAELAPLATSDAPEAQRALEALDEALLGLGDATLTPFQRAIRALRGEISSLEENFPRDLLLGAADDLGGAFKTVLKNINDVDEAAKGFVDGLKERVLDLITQQLGNQLIESLFGGLLGSKSGGPGLIELGLNSLGGLFGARVQHQGGIVGQGGSTRAVPALAFAGAPRFHSGGFPGLRSNEVPTVLERGEEVLTRRDPRNALNGGLRGAVQQAGGGGTVVLKLQLDERAMGMRLVDVIEGMLAREAATQ